MSNTSIRVDYQCVYAYTDGLHKNDRAMPCFSKRKAEKRDKAVEIYLKEAALQALAEM